MDPAAAAFLDAILALVMAKASGRVSHKACATAVAGAVLALGLTREEIYDEAGRLAQAQVRNTMDRLLRESDARRKASS